MILPCPICAGGELTFNVYSDSDGDGSWSRSFTVAELEDWTCDCELTMAQIADLERRAVECAAEAGAPDF